MSELKFREWILDTIDSLRSRKARPDLERICRMVRRRHGFEYDKTCAELEKLIQEQTVLKVNYKGSISYRNAAKVQRRSRKKDDATFATAARRSAMEDASHSDLSNGDSALGPPDPDEEDLEADNSVAMDTDSNADEEGGDESRDGPSPVRTNADPLTQSVSARAASAPNSPSATPLGPDPACVPGLALDCVSLQRAGARPSSLPPSSPRALTHNDWAYGSAACPVERQHPGMQRDKVAVKAALSSVTITSSTLKDGVKKEDGAKAEDGGPLSDQLVPDYAARLERTTDAVSDGPPPAQPLASDNGTLQKTVASLTPAAETLMNGDKNKDVCVKQEKMSQNLLQWSVADVASYFSAAGFPEQAVAFRTQEIDGKSLLLMQRSDVLTGLSIRLGPALKIYERHVKVLQRTHFLECEDA
ncbi:sterile alpha motif domain containing 1a [Synchiropus picturatus]